MICLTGDVHHSLKNTDQKCFKCSEPILAKKYLSIAKKYDIKVTLFITGKAFVEQWHDIKKLVLFDNLEIGGHTWSAFTPVLLHLLFKKLTGSFYGPTIYQKWDIVRTLNLIEKKTGIRPVSWRTHAYKSDLQTIEILHKEKIKIISDEINDKEYAKKNLGNGLISLIINVLPDHEHLYHGYRDEKTVNDQLKAGFNCPITNKSYYIKEYFKIVKSQIKKIEKNQGIATILLHPACMAVSDNFNEFEKFCEWINENHYETKWCKEICDMR